MLKKCSDFTYFHDRSIENRYLKRFIYIDNDSTIIRARNLMN